jgi:NADH-quinone oxidoreductase subunit L
MINYTCVFYLPLLSLLMALCAMQRRQPLWLWGTLACMAAAASISWYNLADALHHPYVYHVYHWMYLLPMDLSIKMLIDPLSWIMTIMILSIASIVLLYSFGYMKKDAGIARFFAYIAFFVTAMLWLVWANDLLQLFIGWEGVGLASYLLIGFWYHKASAIAGNFKAFVINRIGDCALLSGIACAFSSMHTLDFHGMGLAVQTMPSTHITLVAALLWIGAMAKSAQLPLHLWLPESMEGPTPISALIHAATMVTAGVYLIIRLAPVFEAAPSVLKAMACVGATGALLLGLIGVVQNDIKRVVAYSTLSQLGYLMAGLGASAYGAVFFHLITHACFKALLFLGCGACMVACHHQASMTQMGGLAKRLPDVFACMMLGALALMGIPPFSGFFSKEALIDAVARHDGMSYVWWCLTLSAFVTAWYTTRLLMNVFILPSQEHRSYHKVHWTLRIALYPLAIGAIMIGMMVYPMMLSNTWLPVASHTALSQEPITVWLQHAVKVPAVWLTLTGCVFGILQSCRHRLGGVPLVMVRCLNSHYGLELIVQKGLTPLFCTLSTVLGKRIEHHVNSMWHSFIQLGNGLSKWFKIIHNGKWSFMSGSLIVGIVLLLSVCKV